MCSMVYICKFFGFKLCVLGLLKCSNIDMLLWRMRWVLVMILVLGLMMFGYEVVG